MSEKNLTLEEKETINKNTKKASKDLFLEYMPYLIIIFFVVIVVVGGVETVDNSQSAYPALIPKIFPYGKPYA